MKVPFDVSLLPRECVLAYQGTSVKCALSLVQTFEILTTIALDGQLPEAQNKGYDVHNSSRYPGLTFQVKYSNPGPSRTYTTKLPRSNGVIVSNSQWSFAENFRETKGTIADWYVLFGVKDNLVYVFLLPQRMWLQSPITNHQRQRMLKMNTERESYRGKAGYRQNNVWEFFVDEWPDGLYRRLETTQMEFF
jgi:hypothetical protein